MWSFVPPYILSALTQHGSLLFDAPQKTNNFSHGDLCKGALMILNEPGEFSGNTNQHNPGAEASKRLEYMSVWRFS